VKRLLYCVFFGGGRRKLPAPPGVDGRPVTPVCHRGLCAVSSEVEDGPLASTVERILAYEGVVEAFFAERTVVPMRFGSILASEAEVARHLEERASDLRAQLRDLSGCAEMGIRVLALPEGRAETGSAGRSRSQPPPAPGSGHAYLRARAQTFRQDDRLDMAASDGRAGDVVEQYRRALHGLFSRLQVEAPMPVRLVVGMGGKFRVETRGEGMSGGPVSPEDAARRGVLSVSFLVPRGQVGAFRRAFEEMGQGPEMSRLSGPWPPYSFVAP
jgi:hypothetical protein